MAHPYERYVGTVTWTAVARALTELEGNNDIEIRTRQEYVTGYVCQMLDEAGLRTEGHSSDPGTGLSNDEALVLFEFLTRYDLEDTVEVKHPAEARVLAVLHSVLDRQLDDPLTPDYEKVLQQARNRVVKPDTNT